MQTHSVTFTLTSNAANYNPSTITRIEDVEVNVAKATPVWGTHYTSNVGDARTYNGNAQAAAVTLIAPFSGLGAATISYTGTGGTAYPASTTPPTNAGSYAVTVTFAEGANFTAVTTPVALGTMTVGKAAAPVITWPTSATPITYGQTLAASMLSGGAGAGAFAWTTPATAPTVAQSGNSFSVTFTPTDAANYYTATNDVAVMVNQAVPSGTPRVAAVNAAGKTLADAALAAPTGGFVNPFNGTAVTGTLEWDEPLTTAVVQGTTYQWTFTPDDAVNYDVKSGGMVIWPMAMGGTASIPVMGPVGLGLMALALMGLAARVRRRKGF